MRMKFNTPIVTETDLTEALIRAGQEVEALKAENARLREAIEPLVKIADAYDDNHLDDEARKEWAHGANTRPFDQIELYTGRGGRRLLTLQDCMTARRAFGGNMTLREKIKDVIELGYPAGWTADAILAAVKEHLTSDEAMERAGRTYEGYYTSAPVWDGRACLQASILAALGGQP